MPASAEIEPGEPNPDALTVRVIRSQRRRKTSQARIVDNVIEVRIPAWMSVQQEAETVSRLVERVERKRAAGVRGEGLDRRARRLADAHDLPLPKEIRWVSNQQHRWGSCTIDDRTIRISDRLAKVPDYVLDAVVLHELIHLVVPDHGPEFQRRMAAYAMAERAEGFLDAMELGAASDDFVA